MTTYFISRHTGALAWLESQHITVDHHLAHLGNASLQPGDRVIGTLPLQLACRVCEQGAEYWHLSLDIPAQWRGQELTAEQMEVCKARLERFVVRLVPGSVVA